VRVSGVRYALACRYHAKESYGIVVDKLKHIGHRRRRVRRGGAEIDFENRTPLEIEIS
jgi:hypothetical protein